MFADQLGLIASLQGAGKDAQNAEPQAHCDSVLLAVKHPVATLGRMVLDRGRPRVYASFQISNTRGSIERREEINRFRRRLHELFVAFDPLTVEELPLLYKQGTRAVGRTSFHPVLGESGQPKESADQRWDCRVTEQGDYGPLVWEPEQEKNHVGKSEQFYPLQFASAELDELWREEADEATTVVHDHVTIRDLRLVDQADFLVCWRPFWDGRTSGGVAREIAHANDTGKAIYAFVGTDTKGPKALAGNLTHAFTNEEEFWSFLQQKAAERPQFPRPLYY